jgi:hypothetical protein
LLEIDFRVILITNIFDWYDMKPLIIAIDFDGTLTMQNTFPTIEEPRMWLIQKAIEWKAQGHKLILWTCREDGGMGIFDNHPYVTDAVNWCATHGLTFDAVNKNLIEVSHPNIKTSRKINASVFIDDKAVAFDDANQNLTFSCNNIKSL